MTTRTGFESGRSRWWALAAVFSLLWLGAWNWIPGAFTVWATMMVVYVGALGAAILFAPRVGLRPGFDAWRERFFRVGGFVVLSGVLSLVCRSVIGFVLFLIAGIAGLR